MNKQIIAIIVLSVLLVLAAGYIGINKYQQNRQQEQLSIYQQGMQAGMSRQLFS